MRKFIFLLILLKESLGLCAVSTDTTLRCGDYLSKIDHFNLSYPHEKAYLHFDNTCYFLGDTIWFKGYLVNAIQHIPDNWSRTLYVELLTPEGHIVTTQKYKTTDGQCHGQLVLKDSLWAGYYEVRAYTRWMLNFGEGHEFSRVFPVFNKPRREGDYRRAMSRRSFDVPDYRRKDMWKPDQRDKKITIDFFPEGGHLVKGLPARVAFKAVARDSGNLNIRGHLYNKAGQEISSFSTLHDGMGFIEYTPDEGEYIAEFNVGSKMYKFSLPKAETEGCHIKTEHPVGEAIRMSIFRSPEIKKIPLQVAVACRGQVYSVADIQPSELERVSVFFPTKDFPSGVSQITVFNAAGEVLGERLVFIDHHDHLNIQIKQDRDAYRPFRKINLDIQVKDKADQPVSTTLSLSVRDAEQGVAYHGGDIRTYLLLSSEIKGYVHNADYYFEDKSPERSKALDLLLMTQGWSRYVWKQMAGVEPFEIRQPAEENVSIDGVVLEYSRKVKPVKNADIMMWMLGNGESYREKGRTDENGNFVFAFDFWGTWKLSLQVKEKGEAKNCDIRLNRFFSPKPRILSYVEKQIPRENLINRTVSVIDTLAELRPLAEENNFRLENVKDVVRNYDLKEVKVKGRRAFRKEDEGLRYASVAYYLDDELGRLKDRGKNKATDLFEFLAQNNPFYHTERPLDTIDRYKSRPILFVVNNVVSHEFSIPLDEIVLDRIKLITIDERPGAACQYIQCMGLRDIDLVVVHVYTDNNLRTSPKGIRTTRIDGYTLVKEFYHPRYNRGPLPGETDYRRTLYWNPNVRTDSAGRAQVSFYNNGTCRQINISAETVTSDGKVGANGK